MPTASLSYTATPSIPSLGTFRVDWAISAFAEFPDDKVFVLRSSDDGFDHIATVDELSVWPGVKDALLEFYRAEVAQKDFGDPDTGARNMDNVALSLDGLVKAYARFREVFDPPRAETYSETFV